MIKAILPVPNRTVTSPGQLMLLIGEEAEECWDDFGANKQKVALGRNIRIPPLTTYKVYSTWGNFLMEHTFLTDENLDPRNLSINLDIYTGGVANTPPVLIPISVKYSCPGVVSCTHLFVKCIDFLLSKYRFGRKLSLAAPNLLPVAAPEMFQSADCIPIGPYNGVASVNDYLDLIFTAMTNTRIDVDFAQWAPPKIPYDIKSRLTPELPVQIKNTILELIWYERNPDALYHYLDELVIVAGDGRHANPKSLIDEFLYRGPFDPVTALCLNTPSFITLDQLKPYIEDERQLCGFYDIASAAVAETYKYQWINLLNYSSENWVVGDVLEFFYNSPHTDVTIRLTKHNNHMEVYPYDRFGIMQEDQISYNILVNQLKDIFLDWRKSGSRYDAITLSKTWLGELFITCETSGEVTPEMYYVNLNLYHLISPSLVNQSKINSLIGFEYKV